MTKANYGVYGSSVYYAALAVTALLSLMLLVFTDFFRAVFATMLSLSLGVLVLSLVFLLLLSRRAGVVREIVATAKIRTDDRVLDIGTGRGFLAIEIAKAVPGSRTIGIDVWNMPAKGQMHKGFLIGNSKQSAERNALIEGVSDRVGFRQCDARKMPFEPETFDVVVSYAALHQMVEFGADGGAVIQEIHRVLKPRGRLVAVEPIIAKGIMQKLRERGFSEIQISRVRSAWPAWFFMRMLSATKSGPLPPLQTWPSAAERPETRSSTSSIPTERRMSESVMPTLSRSFLESKRESWRRDAQLGIRSRLDSQPAFSVCLEKDFS